MANLHMYRHINTFTGHWGDSEEHLANLDKLFSLGRQLAETSRTHLILDREGWKCQENVHKLALK